MEGSKNRFIIPVYQRNYDWKKENCEQLYKDLVKIIKNGRTSHFFGSIVSVYNLSGRGTEFLIIDGQQRLTTVSLLLLAMYNLISQGLVVPEDKSLDRQIYEEFLVDKYQPEDKKIKLKLVKNDREAFSKLFADEKEYIRDSNLTNNYNYFYNEIQKQEISIDQLFEAICRLEIINIALSTDDDPQLIFESLNSTGLNLSEGDKIRNFILMGLPTNLQNDYYESYWNKIEECTKYDVSSFVRDYLTVKQQAIPSQSRVYSTFKEYVENPTPSTEKISTKELLKDMLAYAKRYNTLLVGGTKNKTLNSCIGRLNRMETTITRPFFLEVLRLADEGKLESSEIEDIFLTTESYIFRRVICDIPTNALNKIFYTLHHEIVRFDGSEDNYVNKFKYVLISKKDRGRFPKDTEFSTNFGERQIYLMTSKNKIYCLERLENYDTLEDKDIYRHIDEGDYSIEHIMPQHLTPTWIRELGDDYEKIHELWLHRIANLTLTAYNSKYSNSSFVDKKMMSHGFNDSGIRLNSFIAKKDMWTLNELEERTRHLTERALSIWAYPVTDYQPEMKQQDSYTLDDDSDVFTGRAITKFTYNKIEQPVSSWVEMYQKVLQLLYAEDKIIITKLAMSENDGWASHFSTNKNDFKKSVEIGDGICVWTNNNTRTKLSILNKLFNMYGVDPAILVFYLRDVNEISDEEKSPRNLIRREFWTYALESIHEAHGSHAFSNVNPCGGNMVAGFFGVSDFRLICVANYDSAQVGLLLGKWDKKINKKAFDLLLHYKGEIEKALGVSLLWERRDDIKSSMVSYKLDGVSIKNESDWSAMASFLAEWSKKFYDVIVPYLMEFK